MDCGTLSKGGRDWLQMGSLMQGQLSEWTSTSTYLRETDEHRDTREILGTGRTYSADSDELQGICQAINSWYHEDLRK